MLLMYYIKYTYYISSLRCLDITGYNIGGATFVVKIQREAMTIYVFNNLETAAVLSAADND